MDFSASISDARELAIEEYTSHVSVGGSSRKRQVATLPGIKGIEGGETFFDKVIFEVEGLEHFGGEVFRTEYERLVRKREEMGASFRLSAKLGGLAAQLDRPDEAVEYLSEALQFKASQQLEFRIAELLQEKGSDKEAYWKYLELAEARYQPAILRLAELDISNRQLDVARERVSASLGISEERWRANLLLGTINLFLGKLEAAISHLRETLREKGNLSNAYTLLAIAHHLKGDSRHVLRDLRAAIAINPMNSGAVLGLSDLSDNEVTSTRFVEEALRFYVGFSDNKKPALERLGRLYYLTNRYKEGAKALEQVVENSSGSSVWNNLGVLYLEAGEKSKAEKVFAIAVNRGEREDKADTAIVNLCQLLIDENRIEEASRRLVEWVEMRGLGRVLDGKYGHVLAGMLVRNCFMLSQYEEGRKWAHRIELTCDRPRVLCEIKNILGVDYAIRERDLQKAVAYAREAYEISDFIDDERMRRRTINNYAFTLLEAEELDLAGVTLKKLKGEYRDPFEKATAGLWHFRLGHLARGEQLYRDAIGQLKKTSIKNLFEQKMWLEIGKIRLAAKEFGKAERAFSSAVKLRRTGFERPVTVFYSEALELLRKARKAKRG